MEADRMGFLLSKLTQEAFENQQNVVQNEKRQNYDNRPLGNSGYVLSKLLYPDTHPYNWQVIGSLDDLVMQACRTSSTSIGNTMARKMQHSSLPEISMCRKQRNGSRNILEKSREESKRSPAQDACNFIRNQKGLLRG